MKIFACCAVGCVLIFLAMGYQAGLFDELSGGSSSSTSAAPPKEPAKNKGPRATYPDALAEACRGKGAPTAAEYLKIPGPHRLVFFDTHGRIYQDWQEKVPDEWAGESVENTELVIVAGKNYKTLIQLITYPNNAPPVARYRHDQDVHVIVAKTGEKIASKRFVSMPRPISYVEDWGLTALGGPVQFKNVFDWIVVQCPAGFPQDPSPLINVFKNN